MHRHDLFPPLVHPQPVAARAPIAVRPGRMTRLLMSIIAACAVFAIAATRADATTYDFSYTFTPLMGTNVVTGSFDGTASGDLITDLSNISVVVNGSLIFHDSGNLWSDHWDPVSSSWVAGGAVASFDGLQNNFLFVDSNFPADPNYTEYYYSDHLSNYLNDLYVGSWVYDAPYTSGTWSVTAQDSSSGPSAVAEPSSMLLVGASLMGLVGVNRRRGPIWHTLRRHSLATARA